MLVTGGSGYLGYWVVRLAEPHWDVTATFLTRPVDEPGITWRQLDVRDAAAVEVLVDDVRPTVILHTAASNPGQDADYVSTNAEGTGYVARAAASYGARLIHISTDVLFDGEKGNYVEEDPPSPITPYGRSKALAEEAVRRSGAEAVIVRTSLIYGWRPRIGRHTRWILDDLTAGRPVRLFADELRCPIWVESLAAAVVELAEVDNDYTGVLHVAGTQTLSRYEFGVRLLGFQGFDPGPIIPISSSESDLRRPLNCTLDSSRARMLLRTPLPGVDEVFALYGPETRGPGAIEPTAP
jgi:dTDP-4-dehydrorhamnose reductase